MLSDSRGAYILAQVDNADIIDGYDIFLYTLNPKMRLAWAGLARNIITSGLFLSLINGVNKMYLFSAAVGYFGKFFIKALQVVLF